MSRIAVIRIDGKARVNSEIESTMKMLNINRKFSCAVFENSREKLGMLHKIKDHATYGEIDDETLKLLKEKRGSKDKKFFALHPPRGGFERKGTKKSFKEGGALGYRGNEINSLIKRMV